MTQAKSKSNNNLKKLPQEWFSDDAVLLAPRLLGKIIKKGSCSGLIVETEAYKTDSASHAHHITKRSRPMLDTYGHWYVYFIYGMHHCVNVTTNKDGIGAILIRAIEPINGISLMQKRRTSKMKKDTLQTKDLCSGPAKLCQAFAITTHENTLPIKGGFAIYDAPDLTKKDICTSTRIGIGNKDTMPWRFYIKNNQFVSRVSKVAR